MLANLQRNAAVRLLYFAAFLGLHAVSPVGGSAQEQLPASIGELAWELGPTGSRANLRALCAPSDAVVWACGSNGTVLRSTDSGSSWTECGPEQFGDLEFRSLHAWNEHQACIASAGTPAVILKTVDGGMTWREVYRHPSAAAFWDGLKFWDAQRGIIFGDPVAGAFCILESTDAGEHWQAIDSRLLPAPLPQEAGFAASNSSVHVAAAGQVWIGTGGHVADSSRILRRESWLASWSASSCPLHSSASEGVFSIAHQVNQPHQPALVAVGGNYRDSEISRTTAAISLDRGLSWNIPPQPPATFCSAVVYFTPPNQAVGFFLATGPAGSYHSADGLHWHPFATTGFHVLAAAPTTLFAAGAEGRFARLTR